MSLALPLAIVGGYLLLNDKPRKRRRSKKSKPRKRRRARKAAKKSRPRKRRKSNSKAARIKRMQAGLRRWRAKQKRKSRK